MQKEVWETSDKTVPSQTVYHPRLQYICLYAYLAISETEAIMVIGDAAQ